MDSNTGYLSHFTRYLGLEWPKYECKMFLTSYSPAAASSSGKDIVGCKGGAGPKWGWRQVT